MTNASFPSKNCTKCNVKHVWNWHSGNFRFLQEMFHDSVESANALGMLSLKAVAIDATEIDLFEAPKPKAKLIDVGNHPNWGMNVILMAMLYAGLVGSII